MNPGSVRVLESIRTFTPLGIRFWDPIADEQIREGLRVTARPFSTATTRPRVEAVRTKSDIYAFFHLSGLGEFERGERDPLEVTSPSRRRPFILEVSDPRRRYLEIAFVTELPLPYRGLFLTGEPASPLPPSLAGFFLYSAPTRVQPAWVAAVRGQLLDVTTSGPAAHALVRVEDPDGNEWFGIADAGGVFLVLLPYPTIAEGFIDSPLIGGEIPLHGRSWNLRISVRYRPDTLVPLPYTDVPDYYSIVSQTGGRVWPVGPDNAGFAEADMAGSLAYGRVLTVRTEGLSELLVSPEPTSP